MQSLLFEPGKIGTLELKNRIIMPPMVTKFGSESGFVTERTKNYLSERALGGVGLIIVEATYVHPGGRCWVNELGISDDRFIPKLRELAETVHYHGAKIAIQVHHGGRMAKAEVIPEQTIAPSALASAPGQPVPKEMTLEDIEETITFFSKAASRAKAAGFDGVELPAAHGYLIDQFLSPASNKRQDAYGGNQSNRARYLVEVVKAVRAAVGRDYPVWCRIDGREYGVEGGITLEDAIQNARMAQEAGVDAIHVSGGGPRAPFHMTHPKFVSAVMVDSAEAVKKAVSIPVIAVGRITPDVAEKILAEGKADFVAIGQGLLTDPLLPIKMASGQMDDIVPCIVCQKCRDGTRTNTPEGISCSVNAALGYEQELRITPTKQPKRIVVVGGGPAGMEAARVGALRGHDVTLYEKEYLLGGQMRQASVPPYKDRIAVFSAYLQGQLKKLGVKVELGKEATARACDEIRPEVLVLATGSMPSVPNVPGSKGGKTVLVGDVLEKKVEVGKRVVVIGGGQVGCETAIWLADQGKTVAIVELLPDMAHKMGVILRPFLLERLVERNIALHNGVKCDEITTKGVVIITKDNSTKLIEADTVVVAVGSRRNDALLHELEGKAVPIMTIGDAVEPCEIREAVAGGYRAARQL